MHETCERCESAFGPCSITIKKLDKLTGSITSQSVRLTICRSCVAEIGLDAVHQRVLDEQNGNDRGDWWKRGEAPELWP